MADDTDAKDVVLLESEGTAVPAVVGTVIKWKRKKTIEIGKEVVNTPIVYRAENGKNQVLLRVPKSTNLNSFEKNMQRSNFVNNLLQSLAPTTEEATKWLLRELAKKHGKIYEEVARERGIMTTQNKKMDAHSAAAMWEDAKVSLHQQRKINRHMGAYFGARLTVPETKVKEIGKDNPELLAAHKAAMEKTTRKRKPKVATEDSSRQKVARGTSLSGNLTISLSTCSYRSNDIDDIDDGDK
jgi:hypothetical protein